MRGEMEIIEEGDNLDILRNGKHYEVCYHGTDYSIYRTTSSGDASTYIKGYNRAKDFDNEQ